MILISLEFIISARQRVLERAYRLDTVRSNTLETISNFKCNIRNIQITARWARSRATVREREIVKGRFLAWDWYEAEDTQRLLIYN